MTGVHEFTTQPHIKAAEKAAITSVASIGGYVTVSERIGGENPFSWSAEISVALAFVQVDGKEPRYLPEDDELFDADEICGLGETRSEAFWDLVRKLSRVTYAHFSTAEWDADAGRPRWTHADVAWDGEKLAPIGGTS